MKQKKIVPVIAIVAAIIVASIAYFYYEQNPKEIKEQWVTSGPFSIDKPRYRLGENIFMVVENLKPNEAGNIIFVLPDGRIYTTIPFNGTMKSEFKQYFTPDTSAAKKIFNPEELTGTWKVVFQGVSYRPIDFEIANEFIPDAERYITVIPTNSTK